MKALFCGLGSIGQRHLRNLRELIGDELEVIAWRQTGHQRVIRDCRIEQAKSLREAYRMTSCVDLDAALAMSPDIAFITNPSAFHVSTAIKAAEAGCDLFIEKPLSHNLRGVSRLQAICVKNKCMVMVGFQGRFHPLCRWTAELIADRKCVGRVISASFEWGAWMPGFHPYEDYRATYAARRDLGGGATLSLIHELDLILRLFGQPVAVKAIGGKFSALEMDADDTVMALLEYPGRVVSLFLSLAQTRETRKYRIQFERATLLVDLAAAVGELYGPDGRLKVRRDVSDMQRNSLFLMEMRNFLECVKTRRQPECDLAEGVESMRLAQRIKRQLRR